MKKDYKELEDEVIYEVTADEVIDIAYYMGVLDELNLEDVKSLVQYTKNKLILDTDEELRCVVEMFLQRKKLL